MRLHIRQSPDIDSFIRNSSGSSPRPNTKTATSKSVTDGLSSIQSDRMQ